MDLAESFGFFFKLCVAPTAVSFPCSHQIFSSLGWFSPCFETVLILGTSPFVAAKFFTGTLSCSSKMISHFIFFQFPSYSYQVKCILPFHNDMLNLYVPDIWGEPQNQYLHFNKTSGDIHVCILHYRSTAL